MLAAFLDTHRHLTEHGILEHNSLAELHHDACNKDWIPSPDLFGTSGSMLFIPPQRELTALSLTESSSFLGSAVFGLTFLSVSDLCWHITPASLRHFEYQTTRLTNSCLSLPLSAPSGTHLWKVQTLGSLCSSSPSAWWLLLTSFFMDCRLTSRRTAINATNFSVIRGGPHTWQPAGTAARYGLTRMRSAMPSSAPSSKIQE